MAKSRNAGFILTAVLFLALSWGCTADVLGEDNMPGTFEGLSAELEMEIKRAYLDISKIHYPDSPYTLESFSLCNLGFYSGNFVVILPILSQIHVTGNLFHYLTEDVLIVYPGSSTVLVWKPADNMGEGRFYGLKESYDSGLLTLNDAREITKKLESIFNLSYDDLN